MPPKVAYQEEHGFISLPEGSESISTIDLPQYVYDCAHSNAVVMHTPA